MVIFGGLLAWGLSYHEPIYEAGRLVGYYYIRPHVLAVFASVLILGIGLFIAGLVVKNGQKLS